MTPSARLSAAIEVLDRLAAGRASADETLAAWGRANRYAGSGDRRAVAERVYAILRERGRLARAIGSPDSRALVLASLALQDGLAPGQVAELFGGDRYASAALTAAEESKLAGLADAGGLGLPDFIERELERSFGADWPEEAEALLKSRAPLDLRVNAAVAPRDQAISTLAAADVAVQPTPYSAFGLRAAAGVAVQKLDAFEAGLFEVQDEGSQIAAWLAGAAPGMKVVDYCAGGGGKTLALAQALMSGQGAAGGRLYGFDTDQRRLDAILPRLERAGARAELRRIGEMGEGIDDLRHTADRLLVDAPCTGSGTWRRRPEQAWRLTEPELARFAKLQGAILDRASSLVKPGGRLAYVTCSVLASENADVTDAFAAAHPEFRPLGIATAAFAAGLTPAGQARLAELSDGGHRVQMSPRRTGTDGFFVALFERTS
jgi:16S rRNA (cytosine967-C5)-methyltransferase